MDGKTYQSLNQREKEHLVHRLKAMHRIRWDSEHFTGSKFESITPITLAFVKLSDLTRAMNYCSCSTCTKILDKIIDIREEARAIKLGIPCHEEPTIPSIDC